MTRFVMGILVAALCLHCDPGSRVPADPVSPAPPAHLHGPRPHPLLGYQAHFLITWNGMRIGDASEALHARDGGLRFERRERITVRRGQALVHGETRIVIDTDASLRAQQVTIRQIASGTIRRGEARRDGHGNWLVTYADEPARVVPGSAVPAELVPLLLAATGSASEAPRARFDDLVMLPGYGFAVARLRMRAAGEGTLLATLSTSGGTLRGRFFVGQSGTVVRVQSSDGSGALRVDAATAAEPFTPPEIVESASVPVTLPATSPPTRPGDGPGFGPGFAIDALLIEPLPAGRPLPPVLPGQRIEVLPEGWKVYLAAGDQEAPPAAAQGPASPRPDPAMASLAAQIIAQSNPASAREEAFALARAAARLIEDDLGAPGVGARSALSQGRGDCTAHALLFAALALARDIPIRLVTGYRLDGARLVRHRWAVVAVDGVWIAVDPTYGEAPAAPQLIGLAVHGPRTAELALADDLAFAGLAGIRAHACTPASAPPPVQSSGPEAVSDRPCARSMPRTR